MTGWQKVVALTIGAVIVLAAFNWSLWRRLKAARAAAAREDAPPPPPLER